MFQGQVTHRAVAMRSVCRSRNTTKLVYKVVPTAQRVGDLPCLEELPDGVRPRHDISTSTARLPAMRPRWSLSDLYMKNFRKRNAMEALWGNAKNTVCANRQYESIDEQARLFVRYIELMTNDYALRKAGLLSPDFWLFQ